MRTYLEDVDIQALVDKECSFKDKASILENIVNFGMASLLPMKAKTKILNETPWLDVKLKKMIRSHQKASTTGDKETFRRFRNQVIQERKACRAKYYKSKV